MTSPSRRAVVTESTTVRTTPVQVMIHADTAAVTTKTATGTVSSSARLDAAASPFTAAQRTVSRVNRPTTPGTNADVGRQRAEVTGETGDERTAEGDGSREHQPGQRRAQDRSDEVDEVVSAEEIDNGANGDPDRRQDQQAGNRKANDRSADDGAVRPRQRAGQGPTHVAHDQQRVEQRSRDDRRLDQVRDETPRHSADDAATRRAHQPTSRRDIVMGDVRNRGRGGGGTDDELLSRGSVETSSQVAGRHLISPTPSLPTRPSV